MTDAHRIPDTVSVAFIGAGLHAVTIALHLLEREVIPLSEIALFDPAGEPLHRWVETTARLGMREMRSPWFHHVEPETMALVDEARRQRLDPLGPGQPTPPVDLFNRFCLTAARPLRPFTHQGRVERVEPLVGRSGYRLHLETPAGRSVVQARHVIHTPGLAGHERRPEGVETVPGQVIDAAAVDVRDPAWAGLRVLVVGAGLTGGTLALRLQERGARVWLASRSTIRQRRYDVDETWMKNAGKLKRFLRLPDLEERRSILRSSRRGSVTPEVLYQLRRLSQAGRVGLLPDTQLDRLAPAPEGRLAATLSGAGGRESLAVDRVVLATGYEPAIERDRCLQDCLAAPGVRTIDGRPVLSPRMELLPDLFLSGWAAELHLGPQARNLIGARLAARIISQTVGSLRPGQMQRMA